MHSIIMYNVIHDQISYISPGSIKDVFIQQIVWVEVG